MKNYIELLKDIKTNGVRKSSRAGGTLYVFGRQLRWDMSEGFPLMTLKKTSFHNIAHELLWFLGAFDDKWKKFGNTNIRYLVDHNVHIWDDDAYRGYTEKMDTKGDYMSKSAFIREIKNNDKFALQWGELGQSYGYQWTNWGGKINQIQQVIDNLKSNPLSRRHIVTAWNPSVIDTLTLPPCHYGFTFNVQPLTDVEKSNKFWDMVENEEINVDELGKRDSFPLDRFQELYDKYNIPQYKLSLKWNQRSVDTPLGLPYNIASYALLLKIVAYLVNMIPNDLVCSLEDTHYYLNQQEAVDTLISREDSIPPLPTLELVDMDGIDNFSTIRFDNFKLINYIPLSEVKAPLSVGL